MKRSESVSTDRGKFRFQTAYGRDNSPAGSKGGMSAGKMDPGPALGTNTGTTKPPPLKGSHSKNQNGNEY